MKPSHHNIGTSVQAFNFSIDIRIIRKIFSIMCPRYLNLSTYVNSHPARVNRGNVAATTLHFWTGLNTMHTVFLVLKDMLMEMAKYATDQDQYLNIKRQGFCHVIRLLIAGCISHTLSRSILIKLWMILKYIFRSYFSRLVSSGSRFRSCSLSL